MLTSMTGHDSVLLRADDPLIDMNYITSFTGMTDKWFYKLISEGHFPKPIKLGRSSRWYKSEVEQWMQQRIEASRGQQHETCCNAGTLAMCKIPALVLWKSALSLVLATCCPRLSFLVLRCNRHRTGLGVLSCVPTPVQQHSRGSNRANNRNRTFRAGGNPAFYSAGGGSLAASAGRPLHTPFGRRKHQRTTDSCILYFLLPTGARAYY